MSPPDKFDSHGGHVDAIFVVVVTSYFVRRIVRQFVVRIVRQFVGMRF